MGNRNWQWILLPIVIVSLLTSCSVTNSSFSPSKKYTLQQVERDYDIFKNLLEAHHPGLYWYTPKDSMDYYFDYGRKQLRDSMTEPEFRKVVSYVTSQINCGHTSVRSSRAWAKYMDTARLGKIFPLSVKVWDQAMVVTTNLNRRDRTFRRGTVITKINGRDVQEIVDTLFEYIPTDGYNRTHKYQTLSNLGSFGSQYTQLFGLSNQYQLEYLDSTGAIKNASLPVFDPGDSTNRIPFRPGVPRTQPPPQPSKRERRLQAESRVRLLKIDTVNNTAMMDLASFGRGYGLRKFFRNSYSTLNKEKINHLIIDVRSNGGGSVNNSTLATKYLANKSFKIADSLYAIRKKSPYQQYIKNHFWNKLFIGFFTKKRKDGYYHFGYFERHYFKPKKKNHYDGTVYILTGGNSFSATTLFTTALEKQDNVIIVGEETGGGAYGNTAWLIPDVTLPETGLRFRLPLFRLVIDKNTPKDGRGVQPEVFSGPTVEAVKNGIDYKLEKTMELIKKDKSE